MGWDKEMMRALEEDGEKLRQMTGEDHGPVFLADCQTCGGTGEVWDDFALEPTQCQSCKKMFVNCEIVNNPVSGHNE